VIAPLNVTSGTAMETLMTTEQLAEFLQVPLATLYQWRHKGTGPKGIKVGKHVRYRRADVEAWLENQAAT
jgi:excisionase family DNA binding protein